MNLIKRKPTEVIPEEQANVHLDIGQMLRECLEYGKPRIHCHDDLTWSAHVELNTDSVISGQVSSGFKNQTPEAALQALLEKLRTLK